MFLKFQSFTLLKIHRKIQWMSNDDKLVKEFVRYFIFNSGFMDRVTGIKYRKKFSINQTVQDFFHQSRLEKDGIIISAKRL